MHACETCGEWQQALKLLASMLETRVPDRTTVARQYAHRFQAGSSYDCLKHMVLVALLQHLVSEGSPFTYIDTHAGGGIYDFQSPEAMRFQNFEDGILKVAEAFAKASAREVVPRFVADLLAVMLRCNRALGASVGNLQYYLGSPAIAQQWLRPGDRAILFETSPGVHADLQRSMDMLLTPQCGVAIEVLMEGSYRWLTAQADMVGLPEKKLVLIDPPYDSYNSYTTWNLFVLRHLHRCWPTSCVTLWYPRLPNSDAEIECFHRRVQELQVGDVLVTEMSMDRLSEGAVRLESSGLLLVHPPPGLDAQLHNAISVMGQLLSPAGTDSNSQTVATSVFWLREQPNKTQQFHFPIPPSLDIYI
jgi:23S rRNA (adenine2030-N6)-methyltransferase